MKEWIVETKALTKKFHNFTAVDQVSFHMKKGSITGLIGPNGAGKSTLMKLMSGLLHETQGELKLFGKHPGEDPFVFRRVGTLIEHAGLYPALNAYDNLKMKALMLGCCSHELITELLKLCSLSTTGKKKAGEFSMGMKRRLGIAMALLGDPELLMRDVKRARTKKEIYEYAWEDDYLGDDKTINVHISNIRSKLHAVSKQEYIETIWGIGFKWKD